MFVLLYAGTMSDTSFEMSIYTISEISWKHIYTPGTAKNISFCPPAEGKTRHEENKTPYSPHNMCAVKGVRRAEYPTLKSSSLVSVKACQGKVALLSRGKSAVSRILGHSPILLYVSHVRVEGAQFLHQG